jgi:hypothetical protein
VARSSRRSDDYIGSFEQDFSGFSGLADVAAVPLPMAWPGGWR